ncbi:MAG: hypothetical protein M0C28_48465 [Candidatus Moduliflexus flocculans]|nr:hypothetical protein [Candidatus Moduliflexus flocculans]
MRISARGAPSRASAGLRRLELPGRRGHEEHRVPPERLHRDVRGGGFPGPPASPRGQVTFWLLALILPASFVRLRAGRGDPGGRLPWLRPPRSHPPLDPCSGASCRSCPGRAWPPSSQVAFTWPQDRSAVLLAAGPCLLTVREVLAVLAMAFQLATLMLALGSSRR